jgi:hypothetical protein
MKGHEGVLVSLSYPHIIPKGFKLIAVGEREARGSGFGARETGESIEPGA